MDNHPDIGYRIKWANPTYPSHQWCRATMISTPWAATYYGAGGDRGVYVDIQAAKMSMSCRRLNEPYEVWKFHIGGPDSDIPYFLPEKVYEKL